ncbi:uncharacterized protein HMPREF1541_08329 [Cyphellophora europaea CBS 101466]|uniref:EF-hand domain-containing protein n=1 Tax=Cyphellophora europaea (strain CBS 101466) TaxID=1220924 RepID=W2RNR8_CYPE1|nr:uncharacterized protein HMPREF1541_08329 [Cyphellophora europaea CBS 101466]ETN37338.1 hypothetical protein HMPREF1541_08329 [Cyphellophora europaea CBS 101466]
MLAGRHTSSNPRPAYSNLPSQQRPQSPGQGGRRPSGGVHYSQQHPPQQSYQRPPQPAQQSYGPPSGQGYSNIGHDARLNSPPPPAGYGAGPRPQGRPMQQQQQYNAHSPARTPQPPDPESAELGTIFQAANVSRSGHLTTTELGSALVNGDYTPFDVSTNQALMRMFSTSPHGQPQGPTLTYQEFQNLWRFLAAWKDLFEKFDEDRSGRISLNEFSNALVALGYRLSQPFVGLLYQTYNEKGIKIANERRGSRGSVQGQGMSFDLFVQACIHLKRMTDVFKNYDDDRDGYITVSFEEFLTEILKLRD